MRREKHDKIGRAIFGEFYMPEIELLFLDDKDSLREFGNRHRKVTHTWKTLQLIEELYGETGRLQAFLHCLRDYGIVKGI